ncbi:MAG: hypothetical protein E6230_22470 [Paenibacillus dendritiformis]|uniref:hypothetical protein n=1 Tax=uncultured Paenibacillus sp. TaxID=227322 RepID=UPI0025EDFC22|nr:hypothetical protein [uncultured Paenibacillus sp.]MDU5144941.1 hypothetical protein [Paenibacillus dendritiformis]
MMLNPQEHIAFSPVPYTFDKYDDYSKQASQLITPLLIKPDGLPEDYVFSKAEVKQPILPNGQKYREEMNAEAKGKPDQGVADIYTYSAAFEMKTLKWQDKEKGIEYRVSVNKSSPLGKKELLPIAETMIQVSMQGAVPSHEGMTGAAL